MLRVSLHQYNYTPEMGRIDPPDTVLTAAGNTRLCTTGMVTT